MTKRRDITNEELIKALAESEEKFPEGGQPDKQRDTEDNLSQKPTIITFLETTEIKAGENSVDVRLLIYLYRYLNPKVKIKQSEFSTQLGLFLERKHGGRYTRFMCNKTAEEVARAAYCTAEHILYTSSRSKWIKSVNSFIETYGIEPGIELVKIYYVYKMYQKHFKARDKSVPVPFNVFNNYFKTLFKIRRYSGDRAMAAHININIDHFLTKKEQDEAKKENLKNDTFKRFTVKGIKAYKAGRIKRH
jgi:hypothetical protein